MRSHWASSAASSPPFHTTSSAICSRRQRGHWAAIYVRQYVIGYNTRSVRPADAPRTWQDLLDPRWKGRLAIDENEIEWYGSMLDYLGRDRGLAFMRALARQEPQLRRGHSLLSKLLVAGDFPLALVHAAEMEEEKKAGAPVEWVRTLDPIVTSPSQAFPFYGVVQVSRG